MNILRRLAQLSIDINKIQAEAALKLYARLGLYRRLYTACGFAADIAALLEERLLALGHEGVAEHHEIVSRLIRGNISFKQFIDDWSQWYSGYIGRSCELALNELQRAG
jgi:hypothetical protein